LKIDGVSVDHFNAGMEGPFGWITRGTLDIDMRLLIPALPEGDVLDIIRDDIVDLKDLALDNLERVISPESSRKENESHIKKPYMIDVHEAVQHEHESRSAKHLSSDAKSKLSLRIYCDAKLHNLKASLPPVTPELSYLKKTLIRPLVSYLNNNRTTISVKFGVELPLVCIFFSLTFFALLFFPCFF